MRCPICQRDNPDSRKYCRECGAKLIEVCPRCGSRNSPGDRFCGECGQSLSEPTEPLSIDYTQPRSYTPASLAQTILMTRGDLDGERKLVTVLFAHVANYTSLSEKLDAEEIHQIMDGCFRLMMDEIHRYEGTIDKFTGDGIMALFGAPIAREDHAQRACYAALAIRQAVEEYVSRVRREYGLDFDLRQGLNSGPVIVGSIGNDLRMDYTAIGDTTNLAARLRSMARPGSVLVSESTYRMSSHFFRFEPVGRLKVKGREQQAEAYELAGVGRLATRFDVSVARGLTTFLGREKEIAVLKEAFDRVRSGAGQVVGIVGEAGVGKSRLLLEMKSRLSEEEYTYLEGRCLHYGTAIAYMPILDLLRSLFDIGEGEQQYAVKKKMEDRALEIDVKLKPVLPPMHEILCLQPEDEHYLALLPHQRRERTFEALRDLLLQTSQVRPLLVAIEDFHWVDKTSEEFMTYLIDWLAGARIMLVLLYRPEYTHPWGSKSYYSQITISQLSPESSTALVGSVLGAGEVSPELRELILSRSGGNPLFVEEFTHVLMDSGSIRRENNHYVLNTSASHIQVPDTIEAIISARIDGLDQNLKRTMQIASVIGKDFAFRTLQRVTGNDEELKAHLLHLQRLELILEKSLLPELEYVFKSAITQEVAYNSLLTRKRKEIHLQVGKAIEALYADRLEEFHQILAHHYSRSGDSGKAYQYLKLSGDKSARHYSNWEAYRYYRDAIGILNRQPPTEENRRRGIEVRLLMEGPVRILAYPQDSLNLLQEGEALARELGDERSLATFYSSIGLCWTFKGEPLKGRAYSEACFMEAEKCQDLDLMAPTGFDLCSSYTISGDHLRLVDLAPRILRLLNETGRMAELFTGPYNFNLYSALSTYYGYGLANLGAFDEGQALCESGLRFAREIESLYSIAFVEMIYGSLFILKGDGQNAVEHLENAIHYGEEGQVVPLMGLAWLRLGWGHYLLGDPKSALSHIEKALGLQSEAGLSLNLSQFYYFLSVIHFDSGDMGRARECADEALRLARTNSEKHLEANSAIQLGRVLFKSDRSKASEAEEAILKGINTLERLGLKPLSSAGHLSLGEHYIDVGRVSQAFEVLTKARNMFREMGMDYHLARTQRVLERLQT